MDALDALRSCGLVGASPQVVSSLAFALAHRHAKRDPRSSALVVGRRREAPPLPVVGSGERPSSGLGGHGSDESLDRVRLKYVESCGDVAWLLNSVQTWPPSAGPRPTLLVLDDVAALAATGAPTLEDDAPLARLLLVAKLASSAAAWLRCDCVVACADASPAARRVLRRHFPTLRVVEARGGGGGGDDGDLVVRDAAGATQAGLRVCRTHIKVS